MAIEEMASLEKLGDSNLTVADPNEDVRGRRVLDQNGDEVGEIEGLIIDSIEHKVRFLQVGSGGFLGLGEKMVLIPVDAITRIGTDRIFINQTREHVARAPRYDPDLAADRDYWGGVYGHYGYKPHWEQGYVYPLYPYVPF
jgi:sporulation protein YlmC with PRC-barrel domain